MPPMPPPITNTAADLERELLEKWRLVEFDVSVTGIPEPIKIVSIKQLLNKQTALLIIARRALFSEFVPVFTYFNQVG